MQIIPVIHYQNDHQAMRNAERAFTAGCDGVFLIEMGGRNNLIQPAAQRIKREWPRRMVGINMLCVDAADAIDTSGSLGLDMTWTDEQLTHSAVASVKEMSAAWAALGRAPGHRLFAGVAFKHQRHEPDPGDAARKAVELGFIPTTSGPATGVAADASAIADLRAAIGPDAPLAIASGITPDNAHHFTPHLSHILVATGVSANFHEFDETLLARLVEVCRQH